MSNFDPIIDLISYRNRWHATIASLAILREVDAAIASLDFAIPEIHSAAELRELADDLERFPAWLHNVATKVDHANRTIRRPLDVVAHLADLDG